MKYIFFSYLKNKLQRKIFSILLTFVFSLIGTSLTIHSRIPKKNKNFATTLTKIIKTSDLHKKTNSIIWKQNSPHKFNEFICSWNAVRPKKGYIDFFISVRHAQWSPWQRIARWSGNDQRSFLNRKNHFVHTKHVRTEMQHKRLSKAFKVKAVFKNGAQKNNLKALFACVVNTNNFLKKRKFNRPSVYIKGIPKQSQMILDHPRATDLCSPTSLSIITHYLTDKLYGAIHYHDLHDYVIDFAEKVHDNGYLDIYGNWLLNVAEAYQASQGDVFYRVQRMNSFNELYQNLVKKIPVAVSVRRLKGGATPYSNGHFVVVIGWDQNNKEVICIDPAFKPSKSTVKRYHIKHFLQAWGLSKNLSYVPLLKQVL